MLFKLGWSCAPVCAPARTTIITGMYPPSIGGQHMRSMVNLPEQQVRAIQASRHGNVLVDTSSARSILPGLVEWAVAEVGTEKILFGTDTPLYSVAMQRARIDQAQISESEKRAILYSNAQRVLDLPALKMGEKP